MNTTVSYTDPGAMLGKTVLKIGQVVLALLAVASGYMAYLASEGLFSGWDIEIEEDLVWLFPRIEPEEWIFFIFFHRIGGQVSDLVGCFSLAG